MNGRPRLSNSGSRDVEKTVRADNDIICSLASSGVIWCDGQISIGIFGIERASIYLARCAIGSGSQCC
jgi:hypothetical protein